MTDRHAGYLVTLDHDLREDDAEPVLAAIRQLRGVAGVAPVVADMATQLAMMRARNEYREVLFRALDDMDENLSKRKTK